MQTEVIQLIAPPFFQWGRRRRVVVCPDTGFRGSGLMYVSRQGCPLHLPVVEGAFHILAALTCKIDPVIIILNIHRSLIPIYCYNITCVTIVQ